MLRAPGFKTYFKKENFKKNCYNSIIMYCTKNYTSYGFVKIFKTKRKYKCKTELLTNNMFG